MGMTLSVGDDLTVSGDVAGGTLNVSGVTTLQSDVSIDGTLQAKSFSPDALDVPGDIAAGTLNVSGVTTLQSDVSIGGTLQCPEDPAARMELCSQSDGSERGPSIDATSSGATKFHVGGVLKVKVSDQGVAIFGSTSFSGNATFNGSATFNGATTFNGAMTVNDAMSTYGTTTVHDAAAVDFNDGANLHLRHGAQMHVQSGGSLTINSGGSLELWYGNGTTTAGSLDGKTRLSTVTFNALSG